MNKSSTLLMIIFLLSKLRIIGQILLTTSHQHELRENPDLSSLSIKIIPAHKNVELIDFITDGKSDGYFKVFVDGATGFIHRNSVNYDDAFYLAIEVRNGNAIQVYSDNKDKVDGLNKRKKYEEEIWQRQNYGHQDNNLNQSKSPIVETNSSSKTNAASDHKSNSNNAKVIQMTRMPGGTYEIPCYVNGLALKFIFDTGASDVSISLTEAQFMFKNGYLNEEDILGTQYYSIANGDIAEGTTIRIRKLEFGGVTLYNVDAAIVHELQAPLLLGQSAISRLGKIQIDPDNSTLTIIE